VVALEVLDLAVVVKDKVPRRIMLHQSEPKVWTNPGTVAVVVAVAQDSH
jgi:hypothetical protein